ncbi:coiled-coil domain-containing protein 124-like [Argiope bruennichi]|uniref:Coiled-coil domain-containing protein 124-A n=1 Tax=Argiope bruennichi TaxID=94029 RepID=A0A8T0EFH8_ARGBR|nr:coiled-coil domain-containing protein 124-like [Argiope bruennichi]KAF8771661.1 Coiled-coil domain-containing protein 124-A [Argiope bruennichi]
MPKKFGGNTKAIEARERKEAVKNAEKEKKEREAEEAMWRDDDKHVMRKQQRKEEREKKKQEQQEKKLLSKMVYEEEMNSIKPVKAAPTKVTRAEIAKTVEKSTNDKPKKELLHDEKPLEENVNRLQVEGEVARSVDDAIAILSISNEKVDLHPEKRVKAAYQAFEERNLPILKAENPNLRLSQLKQMLKKDWMKSPENPLNQR